MLDKEQKIKEERTTEAMRKGLMGLTGKLACIARFLGSKIISETSDGYSSTPMIDVWALESEEEDYTKVHESDEDGYSRDIGFIFDGLSRGMHLEIKYMFDEKSLSVYYKGIRVYRETTGDLECYAAAPEWEEMIEKLFKVAKQIADHTKKEETIKMKIQGEKNKNDFLERLKLRWGI